MSTALGTHSGAGSLSLMFCVRESSPLQDFEINAERTGMSRKRFWNPKRWFKKKNKASEDVAAVDISERDTLRSRSTSELSISEETSRRRSSSAMHPGLSVSHDSVFHSPNSGSDIDLDVVQTPSISFSQNQIDLRLQSELNERLRLRRSRGDITSEDDEGFPNSPCNSPTHTDGFDRKGIKDLPTQSHSNTCSDGSLLSMEGSEMDEEPFIEYSGHPFNISPHERANQDLDLELKVALSGSIPLNHSGAHHKAAVRPKKRAPHRRRTPKLSGALPITHEVNEEASIRSASPEKATQEFAATVYSSESATVIASEGTCSLSAKNLNRKGSNSGSKSSDQFSTLSQDTEFEEKVDKSFFDRIFPRRSAKKRKSKEEKLSMVVSATNPAVASSLKHHHEESYTSSVSYAKMFESKPIPAPRSGAATRQRVVPIDLPTSSETEYLPPAQGSPMQFDFENSFLAHKFAALPQKSFKYDTSAPTSPFLRNFPSYGESTDYEKYTQDFKRTFQFSEVSNMSPEFSPLQDRLVVTRAMDEVDDNGNNFTSLKDVPDVTSASAKSVIRSHSFKTAGEPSMKAQLVASAACTSGVLSGGKTRRVLMGKSNSLDGITCADHSESEAHTVEAKDRDSCPKSDVGSVTVLGPSQTAAVNLPSDFKEPISPVATTSPSNNENVKDIASVSKIPVKSSQASQIIHGIPKSTVPEFLNKHLNRVETRSATNVVLSMNTSRIVDEQKRIEIDAAPPSAGVVRKFSQENLEIFERDEEVSCAEVKEVHVHRFMKKGTKSAQRHRSVTSESPKRDEEPFTRNRSISLDSLKGDSGSTQSEHGSSQDSLDKVLETKLDRSVENTGSTRSYTMSESIVLRKKSLVSQNIEEEPELMKVFARRSLLLKDDETDVSNQQVPTPAEETVDQKTRESNKENRIDSLKEDHEKTQKKEPVCVVRKEPATIKEALSETNSIVVDSPDVTLRKAPKQLKQEVTLKNSSFGYQRSVSLNNHHKENLNVKLKKRSFSECRKVDDRVSEVNFGEDDVQRKFSKGDVIAEVPIVCCEIISQELQPKTKNFNQRKAEWEKRAQAAAQKKSVP